MRDIETVVFDLGGVLIDWNPRYVYNTVFEDPKEVEFFLTEVCSNSWNAEQDRGRTFEEAIRIKQAEFPKYHREIAFYFERWTEMIGGPINDTVEILEKLFSERKTRLYALTNWSAETFPFAWENYSFLKLFEGILVSGKENLIKPDPKIYELLLSRFDIQPEKSLFIDDSLKNVEGARSCNMHAIHYKSPSELKKELLSYEVLA